MTTERPEARSPPDAGVSAETPTDQDSVHGHLSRREFGRLPGDRAHATFPRKRRYSWDAIPKALLVN